MKLHLVNSLSDKLFCDHLSSQRMQRQLCTTLYPTSEGRSFNQNVVIYIYDLILL